jgi:sec-independent protein translocase protein TatA
MFGDIIQPTHLLFILVVALLVLGPKRLPEVGRSLGRGLRDFRQGMQGVQDEARGVFHGVLDEPAEPDFDSAMAATVATAPAATAEPVVSAAGPTVTAAGPTVTAAAAPAPAHAAARVATEPDPADYAD